MSADLFPFQSTPSRQIFFHEEEIKYTHPSPLLIKTWIDQSISKEDKDFDIINIIFCSDEYLLDLNKTYLDHDTYTDIITFQYGEFPIEGDLFISIDRVRDNAQKMEISELEELNRVIIHGILHLLGYSDKTPEQKKLMTLKENEYLKYLRGLNN
jgi:rRNA maturation RNase YbeY